ncbi:MAG: hypothetical protein AABW58_03245 [Nanoarchaeota archaeon]
MPKEKNNEGEVFVRLPNEADLRTDMLEAARTSTQVLKDFDKVSFVLKQKKKESFKLKLLLSEIKSLSDSLQFSSIDWFDKKPESEEQKLNLSKKQKEENMSKEKKDQLTMDLEEIEKKLNSLKF